MNAAPASTRPWAFLAAVAALGGTLPLAGLRPAELALLGALAALGGVRLYRGERPIFTVPTWVDTLVVVALTAAFFVGGAALADPDQPTGTDWFDYLGNAVAVATGDWPRYHDWRGPLHAWACLALLPLSGGLIAASQHLALVCATALVPLTWGIGRMLLGRWPALLAAGLLAGWADLRLFAVYSTPYALLAATGTLGLGLVVASRERSALVVPASVALAAAVVTDLRGLLFAGAVGVAALVDALLAGASTGATDRPRAVRRRLGAVVVTALLTAALATGAFAALPVPLRPLWEQIALQKDLHAREGAEACSGSTNDPLLTTAFGPCGRATLANNLGAGAGALPIELATIVVLVGLGLLGARERERGAGLYLLLPLLPTVPSLLLVGAQHRYFVPLAPLIALLGGGGLAWLTTAAAGSRGTDNPGARRGLAGLVGIAIVVGLAVAWHLAPGSLWSRAHTGRAVDPGSVLEGPSPFGHLRAALRPRLAADDAVVDCARAGLDLRLYPHPVTVTPPVGERLPRTCAALLRAGSHARGVKWLVVVVGPEEPVAASWEVAWRAPESPGREVLLLRSDGAR